MPPRRTCKLTNANPASPSFFRFCKLICFPLAAVYFGGCITPPQIEHSSVIDNSELALISNIKRGKDYALSGRMDLAELQFRRQLMLYPAQSSIYSDLGYVLIEQNRLEEAVAQLRMAIKLNPLNLPAREHLARTYYRQDKYEESIAEYTRLLDVIFQQIAKGRVAETSRSADVMRIYRDMAVVYHALGLYDEAICLSQLSRDIGGDALQHIRLLMSLDRVKSATSLLRQSVAAQGAATPPAILLDLGVALIAAGDKVTGAQALDRALSAPASDAETRSEARLIKLKLASDAADADEQTLVFRSLKDENPRLCDESDTPAPLYWPTAMLKDFQAANTVVQRLCSE